MSALLRAELLKLRTTRTFAAMVGAAAGLSLLVVVLSASISDNLTQQDARDLLTADFTSLFIVLLGVMGMAGEWRHRTITSSVLAAPDRLRLLAAKVVAYAVAGAVLSLVVTVTIMLVGTAILAGRDLPTADFADLADVLWRNLTVAALLGALGVCVGALIRNQIAAIIGVLLFAFVLEPTLSVVASDVGKYGPLMEAPAAILDLREPTDDDQEVLGSPAAGVGVLLAWIGVTFAAGAALLRARDLT